MCLHVLLERWAQFLWFYGQRRLKHQTRVRKEDFRSAPKLQFYSCHLNSYNSEDHLNRTNSLVPSEIINKLSQENSFILNSHFSKNH